MHFYHIYLVKATSSDDATQEVDSFLESYSNKEFDYYTIKQISLSSKSGVMPLKGNEKHIWPIIQLNLKEMDKHFKRDQRDLVRYMKLGKYSSLDEIKRNGADMVGYMLCVIGKWISGYFTSKCFFYDISEDSPDITEEQFLEAAATGDYYVVEVNIHN